MNNENNENEQKSSKAEQRARSSSISETFVKRFNEECSPHYIIDHNGEIFITHKCEGVPSIIKIEKNSSERYIMTLMRKFLLGGGSRIAQGAIEELQSIAFEKGLQKKVYVRNGKKDNSIYIDLANPQIKGFIKIDPDVGFQHTTDCPVPLWTSPILRPLPYPKTISRNEFFKIWETLFNFEEDYGSYLLLVFVLKCLIIDSGTCPFLIFEGPQGSGKSTMTKIVKELVDPTHPLLVTLPDKEETIAIIASLTLLPAFDNISRLNYDTADALCRLSTGSGLGSKRKLFSNSELSTFDVQRSVIFNGIEDLSSRPDFQDRSITLHLKSFDKDEKILKSDSVFWEEFKVIHGNLLGGLYEILSQVLGVLPSVTTTNLPRLSDFTRVGLALDKVLDKPEGHFEKIFTNHQKAKIFNLFSNDEFALRLKEILEKNDGKLEDSPMKILLKINSPERARHNTNLPKNIMQFRGQLKRSKAVLEEAYNIKFLDLPRSSSQRMMRIWIENYEPFSDSGDLLI